MTLRVFLLFFRACLIAWVFVVAVVTYAAMRIAGRGRGDARDRLRGEVLARALERLGATFVKLGQIAATRPDLFPEGVTRGRLLEITARAR